MAEILWSNSTIEAPTDVNETLVVASQDIVNNNGKNSIKVTLDYTEINPSPTGERLKAQIEENLGTNANPLWSPIAPQNEFINSDDNAPKRIIDLSPRINIDAGIDIFIQSGLGVRVSNAQGVAPEKMRVAIYREVNSEAPLENIVLTGHYRLYNS